MITIVYLVVLDGDAGVVDDVADGGVHLGPNLDAVITADVQQVVRYIDDRVPDGVAVVVVDLVTYLDTVIAGELDVVSGDGRGLLQGHAVLILV